MSSVLTEKTSKLFKLMADYQSLAEQALENGDYDKATRDVNRIIELSEAVRSSIRLRNQL